MAIGFKLLVQGERALFTRPEMKAERVSYDVITPSAARGILEAIHWKPAIRWVIDKIHVLEPIRFENLKRNEIAHKVSSDKVTDGMKNGDLAEVVYYVDQGKNRQPRASTLLRDVAYVIEAHFELTAKAGDDTEAKHAEMFRRRASNGQCFHQPCLGTREFPAEFELLDGPPPPSRLPAEQRNRDLGWMLYDIDFANSMTPLFYRPQMVDGIIDVAAQRPKEARA